MRLFLYFSFFFLFTITEFTRASSSAPPDAGGGPSGNKIKCYEYTKIYQKEEVTESDKEERECDKSCFLTVYNFFDVKRRSLSCLVSTFGEENGCYRNDKDHIVMCWCSSDLCFTPESSEAALEKFVQTGNLTFEFFKNFAPGAGRGNGDGNSVETAASGNLGGYQAYSHGSDVFFATCFLVLNAALVLAM